jgi:hypothetical protein
VDSEAVAAGMGHNGETTAEEEVIEAEADVARVGAGAEVGVLEQDKR